jgi:hypothetical protein
MKRCGVVLFAIVFLLSIKIWAADQMLNISGTWLQDAKLSNKGPQYYTGVGSSGGGMLDTISGRNERARVPGLGSRDDGSPLPSVPMNDGIPSPGGRKTAEPFRGSSPPRQILVIEQTAQEISINSKFMNGQDVIETFSAYAINGQPKYEYLSSPLGKGVTKDTKTKLTKNSFVIIETYNYPIPTSTKKTYSLSKDGKTLTLKISGDSGFGSSFTQKMVFQKQ